MKIKAGTQPVFKIKAGTGAGAGACAVAPRIPGGTWAGARALILIFREPLWCSFDSLRFTPGSFKAMRAGSPRRAQGLA